MTFFRTFCCGFTTLNRMFLFLKGEENPFAQYHGYKSPHKVKWEGKSSTGSRKIFRFSFDVILCCFLFKVITIILHSNHGFYISLSLNNLLIGIFTHPLHCLSIWYSRNIKKYLIISALYNAREHNAKNIEHLKMLNLLHWKYRNMIVYLET